VIHDQIVRFPTGNTNTDGDAEVTKANVGDGWIWGTEFGGAWRFASEWTLFGNATYLKGKVDTYPTSAPVVAREYMSRLMPPSAQVGVRWEQAGKRFWAEVLMVAVADADRLSTRDRNDTQRIPPGGTPGYAVFYLRGGWNITEKVALIGAVENLLDEDYRVHGSGQNMPGLNFVGALSVDF
jgi:hemoglobin/transferrin/lactoferrin receptor protein